MPILLFILYSLFCGIAIVKMRFIRESGIRPAILLLFFALHVGTGLLHNYIAYRYFPGHGDIWDYFWKSFMYRYRLLHDFNAFRADNSTWTYVTHNGIIYIQMVLSFLSLDRMDVNTLLFSFPVFLGKIALFRLFRERFPNDPLTAFTVFLLPSTLFWTSCIYREGVLYMLSGFLLLAVHRMLTSARPVRRLPAALLCFVLIFYFRSGFALTLLAAGSVWWYKEKPHLRPMLSRIAIALTGIVVVVVLAFPGLQIPVMLARWQNEFYDLYGHSRIPLPAMDGSWAGLFRVSPAAVRNGLFEPLPGAGGQTIYLVFSIELLGIWAIAALALLRNRLSAGRGAGRVVADAASGGRAGEARVVADAASGGRAGEARAGADAASGGRAGEARAGADAATEASGPGVRASRPFGWFAILFCLTGMVLIGLFVPFAGTIVRYRSIYLPFLLAPGLHGLSNLGPLRRLNDWFSRKAFTRTPVPAVLDPGH